VWEKQLTLPYELVKTSCRLRQCKGKNKYWTNKKISEEERKKLGRGDGEVINADDPRNRDLIRRMISE
jgi:hypothetical protein